jgi:L-lactate dehydrogenase complex protein LldF
MRIPLPKMMRHWREEAFEQRVTPVVPRTLMEAWAFFARRPRLYGLGARLAARALKALGRDGKIRRLPLGQGWTEGRDFPAPQGRTFQEMWSARRGPRS